MRISFQYFPVLAAAMAMLSWTGGSSGAESLSLDGYLDLVRQKNGDYLSAGQALSAARGTLSERSLLVTPSLFGGYDWASDRSRMADVSGTVGSNRMRQSFSIGIQEQTPVGLNAKIAFQQTYDSIEGLQIPFYPANVDYFTPRFTIELQQDLLRNFFGREVRARRSAVRYRSDAQSAAALFQMKQVLNQAEVLYWRTSLSGEVVRIQEDLLARSRKIYEWVSDRVERQLQDRSDLLQSQADVQYRTLELESARDDELRLRRAFNLMIGIADTDPFPELLPLSEADLRLPASATNGSTRGDIAALAAMDRAYAAESVLKKESVTPVLSAFFSASWNALDQDPTDALKDLGRMKHDTLAAGFRLTAPFDLPGVVRLRKAYAEEYGSRAKTFGQRSRDAESERVELLRRIAEMRDRLRIAGSLVEIQQRKADNERERLSRGNTVTFQVLLFEQDLGRSRLMRLDIQGRLIEMLAQLRLYE
jgi:outer membrane protein TolC